MNDRVMVCLLEIFGMLPDAEAARVYLEDQRWEGQPVCPHCGGDSDQLRGMIEIDETFVAGKEGNKHADKKLNMGCGTVSKQAVWDMRERGRFVGIAVEGCTADVLHAAIVKLMHVAPDSTVHTAELASYNGSEPVYDHETINRGADQYVKYVGANAIHLNSAGSMWADLKRGLYGTWHKARVEHLHRYVNKCTFWLNEGNVKVHPMHRIKAFLRRAFKVQLDCNTLIEAEA